jgi:hypothetical protein
MNDRTTTTFSKKEMGNASYAYMANEGRLAQMDHLWRGATGIASVDCFPQSRMLHMKKKTFTLICWLQVPSFISNSDAAT